MSRICCISKKNTPCTYEVLKSFNANADSNLNKKIKTLVVGSFFPLFFPTACICDLTINIIRICKPNFFRASRKNKLPSEVVKKVQNISPKVVKKIQTR